MCIYVGGDSLGLLLGGEGTEMCIYVGGDGLPDQLGNLAWL